MDIYCKLSKCIGQTPCSYEHYLVHEIHLPYNWWTKLKHLSITLKSSHINITYLCWVRMCWTSLDMRSVIWVCCCELQTNKRSRQPSDNVIMMRNVLKYVESPKTARIHNNNSEAKWSVQWDAVSENSCKGMYTAMQLDLNWHSLVFDELTDGLVGWRIYECSNVGHRCH